MSEEALGAGRRVAGVGVGVGGGSAGPAEATALSAAAPRPAPAAGAARRLPGSAAAGRALEGVWRGCQAQSPRFLSGVRKSHLPP